MALSANAWAVLSPSELPACKDESKEWNNCFLVIDSKDQEHTSYDPWTYDVKGETYYGGSSLSTYTKKGTIKVFDMIPKDTYLKAHHAGTIISTTDSEDCKE